MSAPDTNVKEQERQHKTPLTGMRLGLVFAAILMLVLGAYQLINADGPEGAETQVEVGPGVEVTEPENPVPAENVD